MDYEKQAQDFLRDCGVLFVIEKAVPQLSPRWAKNGKHGTQWSVQLGLLKEKPSATVQYWGTDKDNLMHCDPIIQFFFWSSIVSKEKAEHSYKGEKKPSAYDVLASIYSPAESFEDFCSNYGYDTDSREAYATYEEVRALNAKIESVFTPKQLEALQEIQ